MTSISVRLLLLRALRVFEGEWEHGFGARGSVFDDTELSLQAAIRGQRVTLARDSRVADKLRRGALVEPLVQRVAARSAYYLVHPLAPAPRASVHRFREWLLAQIVAPSTPGTHAS